MNKNWIGFFNLFIVAIVTSFNIYAQSWEDYQIEKANTASHIDILTQEE